MAPGAANLAAQPLTPQITATMPVQTLDSGIATINTDTAAALGYDLTKVEEAFKPLTTEIVETTTSEKFEN